MMPTHPDPNSAAEPTENSLDSGSAQANRTHRAAINVAVGGFTQVAQFGLAAITRVIFLHELSVELLGVNALITNVVTLVAVADLGFQGALMFALYKPLGTRDFDQVAGILNFATKFYHRIAVAIAILGIAGLYPVLLLVGDAASRLEVVSAYLLMLLGSVLTYFLAQRQLLLLADQRFDLVRLTQFVTTVVRSLAQIIVLVLWQSFIGFCALQAVFTVLGNLWLLWIVRRRYPMLSNRHYELPIDQRRSIWTGIKAMISYRFAGVIIHQTDPITISAFSGVAILGLYSNYLLIIGTAQTFASLVFDAISPTIGNAIAQFTKQRSYALLSEIMLFATLLFCTIGSVMAVGLSDLIKVWLGPEYTMPTLTVLLAVANFVSNGLLLPIGSFRTGTGLFRDVRYLLFSTAIANLGLSVLMGHWWGINGVLFATLVARLATNFWFEPLLLLRRYVGGRMTTLLAIQVTGAAAGVVATITTRTIMNEFELPLILLLLCESLITAVIVVFIVFLCWGRTSPGRDLISRLRVIFDGIFITLVRGRTN